jgi:hypothetical protein
VPVGTDDDAMHLPSVLSGDDGTGHRANITIEFADFSRGQQFLDAVSVPIEQCGVDLPKSPFLQTIGNATLEKGAITVGRGTTVQFHPQGFEIID